MSTETGITSMTDRLGNPVAVGDRVFVLPRKGSDTTGAGYVRRIKHKKARVDNGKPDQADFENDDSWIWSAWVTPNEIEKL